MHRPKKYCWFFALLLILSARPSFAQVEEVIPVIDSNQLALSLMKEQYKKWGPNDTIVVPAILYNHEIVNYKELDMVWLSNLSPEELAAYKKKWYRLRNAVYITYPYARIAGATINDINDKMAGMKKSRDRKKYIRSREKDLKERFKDPLTNLSVYQGKILMKLINRQTGNNCYEILKEYKGGLRARLYQTVAWFIGGDLKQNWDVQHNPLDRQIENIVNEINGNWYQNPYRHQ